MDPQILCPIELDLRKFELRLHPLQLGCGSIKIRLVGTRIDHVKQIALLDDRAGLETDFGDVTRHARPDVHRFNRFQTPGEFVPFVYLFLDHA